MKIRPSHIAFIAGCGFIFGAAMLLPPDVAWWRAILILSLAGLAGVATCARYDLRELEREELEIAVEELNQDAPNLSALYDDWCENLFRAADLSAEVAFQHGILADTASAADNADAWERSARLWAGFSTTLMDAHADLRALERQQQPPPRE